MTVYSGRRLFGTGKMAAPAAVQCVNSLTRNGAMKNRVQLASSHGHTGTLQQDHRVAPTTSQSSQRAGQAPPVRSWRYVLQMAQFGGRPEYPAQNDASRRGAGRVKGSCALVPHRQLTLAISLDSPGPRCFKTVKKSNVPKIPTPQYLICF